MKTLLLSLTESFHTIIIKKQIGDFTYLAAIGYEGGGEYAEFCGKFWSEPDAVGYRNIGTAGGGLAKIETSKQL